MAGKIGSEFASYLLPSLLGSKGFSESNYQKYDRNDSRLDVFLKGGLLGLIQQPSSLDPEDSGTSIRQVDDFSEPTDTSITHLDDDSIQQMIQDSFNSDLPPIGFGGDPDPNGDPDDDPDNGGGDPDRNRRNRISRGDRASLLVGEAIRVVPPISKENVHQFLDWLDSKHQEEGKETEKVDWSKYEPSEQELQSFEQLKSILSDVRDTAQKIYALQDQQKKIQEGKDELQKQIDLHNILASTLQFI